MLENKYQAQLIKTLGRRFPGCVVLKNDPEYIQGIPDLTILYEGRWACLEVKGHQFADVRPNQDYWVEYLDKMYFAAFIYPENEAEILDALQQAFEFGGNSRLPER